MSDQSGIQWTDATWNPVAGCTRVSAGCDHCYAVRQTYRLERMGQSAKYGGLTVLNPKGERHFNGQVRCDEDALVKPFSWKKPRRIFVNSMSDLFHKDVPASFIARVFAVMGLASWHTFQVLTKRPERMEQLLTMPEFLDDMQSASHELSDFADDAAQRFGLVDVLHRMTTDWRAQDHSTLPLRNVWLGTSCENQGAAEERIPWLLKCPAAVRFLSCEPLLGPVDLRSHLAGHCPTHDFPGGMCLGPCPDRQFIHWVIVGGESGPNARACEVGWIRSLVRQCQYEKVPVFVKQLGKVPILPLPAGADARQRAAAERAQWLNGRQLLLKDSHGGDMAEWPEDLRVREMPGIHHREHRGTETTAGGGA